MHTIYEQLELHEGRRSKVYLDSLGIPSIGVGRNLRDRGLRPDEIDFLLANDVHEVVEALQEAFPFYNNLNLVRQRVLIDMGFMGVSKLKKFKKMIAALKAGDYSRAADEMLKSKWAGQVKGRAVRLSRMMATGADYVV